MKLYVAADYDRREEAQTVTQVLKQAGHEIVSTWLEGEDEETPGVRHTDQEKAEWARRDIADLHKAEGLVVLTQPRDEPDHAGHHFEAGYCHAHRMPIFVLGPVPTCFYVLFWGAEDIYTLLDVIANYKPAVSQKEAVALNRLRQQETQKRQQHRRMLSQHRLEPDL